MTIKAVLSFGICGLCVGWLMGLAVSPIVGLVLTSLMGVLAALLGAAAGISEPPENEVPQRKKRKFDAAPLALVLFGIVIGSACGLFVRTHSLLSPDPESVAAKWKDLEGVDVRRRLFDQLYPEATTSQAITQSTLYGIKLNECKEFRTADQSELQTLMQSSVTMVQAKKFAMEVSDPATLKLAVEIFLCP